MISIQLTGFQPSLMAWITADDLMLEMSGLIRRRRNGEPYDEGACIVFVGRLIHRRLKDLRLQDQRRQAERWFTSGECEAWCDVTPEVSFEAVMDMAEKAIP